MPRPRPDRPIRVSKFLARHLRHAPEAIGIELDEAGWTDVDALLAAAARAGFPITRAELDRAVHAPGKRRYVYGPGGRRIRAAQGHSVAVELGLEAVAPPAELFHGTHPGALEAVLREGLRPMGRRQVHLSADRTTARAVGARRGRPVVLVVEAAALAATGVSFYRAENGVWLVDHVPPAHLRRDDGPLRR